MSEAQAARPLRKKCRVDELMADFADRTTCNIHKPTKSEVKKHRKQHEHGETCYAEHGLDHVNSGCDLNASHDTLNTVAILQHLDMVTE